MASYAKSIADALVTTISGIVGAPELVKQRKDNTLMGRETPPGVIVSIGDERKVGRTFEGTIFKEYEIIVGIYRTCLADVSTNLDLTPEFILKVKQALDVGTIASVPVVWDVDLVDNPEWEHQPFGQGWEVSRFGLLVKTAEPRNG